MILGFSDLKQYVDTVFQCRIDVYVVKCESVLNSRQRTCAHKTDPRTLKKTWKRFLAKCDKFEIYIDLS
jgi:hypothetical protein